MLCLILPLILTVSFFMGWLRLKGNHADLYEIEVGISLFVASNIIILFSVSTWINVQTLNASTSGPARSKYIKLHVDGDGLGEERLRLFVDAVQDYALLMLDVGWNRDQLERGSPTH